MDNDKLHTISEVVNVSSHDEVNKYLKLGWTILSTVGFTHPDGFHGHSFSMGWSSELGEPKHPVNESKYL